MKKLFTLFFLAALFQFVGAQTLHKQYPINYCGTGYCHQSTIIHGGRYYIAYVEDTLAMPMNKLNLTVLKNDENGNVIWKRTIRFSGSYTATAAPRKILASGPNLYIGGNLHEFSSAYPFIASIDTTNGNINYFNKYTTSFTSNDVIINDLTLLNNGDVMAVGRIGSGFQKFLYCLRVNGASGAIVNNGMSTFYSDQEAFSVCQLSNSSIFIVGQRGLMPFIAKLTNNSALAPGFQYNINGGVPSTTNFTQIIKAGNKLMLMGTSTGTGQNNFIAQFDTTLNGTIGSPYTIYVYTMNSFLPTYLYYNGSQTLVSGVSSGGNSLLFYNSSLAYSGGYSYGSTGSMDHSIQYYNNNSYLTTGTYMTGGSLSLYKGNSAGLTICTNTVNPSYILNTLTYTLGQIGVFSNGNLTSLSPSVAYTPINPVTTCISTNVNELSENLADVKLYTNHESYVFHSGIESILSVEVYDINGKLISKEVNINSNDYQFFTSGLNSGVYLAKVNYGSRQKSFKLIKQ